MTKENISNETAEQRESRLEQLLELGTRLCRNDLNFLLLRRAARLDLSELVIAVQRSRNLLEQQRLQKARQGN